MSRHGNHHSFNPPAKNLESLGPKALGQKSAPSSPSGGVGGVK